MTYRLGVDLGTTCTAAALLRADGTAEVVRLGEWSAAVPTTLFLGADGSVLFGDEAEARAEAEPSQAVRHFKGRIGDPVPMVIGSAGTGAVEHHAHDLAAAVIAWVVAKVAAREGGAPAAVAVTVPAAWDPRRTELFRTALAAHDLPNLTLVPEPEAAAHAHARANRLAAGDTLAVYDLGGGTFDAAVLRADGAGRLELLDGAECLADVSGTDIDDAVVSHVLGAVSLGVRAALGLEDAGPDADGAAAVAAARLRAACVEAKETLSAHPTAKVSFGGAGAALELTRTTLELLILRSVMRTLAALDRCAESAGTSARDVSTVLLVGSSSRIPLVAQLVSAHVGPGVEVVCPGDPKLVFAIGAALAPAVAGAEVVAPAPRPVVPVVPAGPVRAQRTPVKSRRVAVPAAVEDECAADLAATVRVPSAPPLRLAPAQRRPVPAQGSELSREIEGLAELRARGRKN